MYAAENISTTAKHHECFASWLIAQNQQATTQLNQSGLYELRNFLSFSKTMIWAYPAAYFMRWKIRRNKPLQHILQYPALLSVRNNIEKGSFAYDSLLFKENIFSILSNRSHLANLVCLAILFGDEFIDGIATAYGKQKTAALLNNKEYNFYLQHSQTSKGAALHYAFDICSLLPQAVLNTTNDKYNITYTAFYKHLLYLLAEMNRHLQKLEATKSAEAAALICRVCNLCFDTYKTDISYTNNAYSLDELLNYQKSKDDDIIHFLLTLRAVLLNKKQLQYQKQFSGWSSMVRSMQLYDDMEDAAKDCDFQMNACCWFAQQYFADEWQWLQRHKNTVQLKKDIELNACIALHMPASCMMVMQYAQHIACTKLSWVQRKITNYLWRKNWLGFTDSNTFSIAQLMQKPQASAPLQLHYISQKINNTNSTLITSGIKAAWIIDIALMDASLRSYIRKKISRKEWYRLTNCFLEYSVQNKAQLLQKIMKQ
jgi:hypothetical protein